MARRGMVWATTLLMALVCGSYFALAILYLAPPNPVKALHLARVYAIMHPLFQQNWHLFAPVPIRSNFVLIVRCRTGTRITEWIDVTMPMLARHHRQRNSPWGRVLRIHNAAVHQLVGRTTDEWLPLICKRSANLPACRGEDPATQRQRQVGMAVIYRVALSTCRTVLGPDMATATQARILIHEPPPWSQRLLPSSAGQTRFLTLPWQEAPAWGRR